MSSRGRSGHGAPAHGGYGASHTGYSSAAERYSPYHSSGKPRIPIRPNNKKRNKKTGAVKYKTLDLTILPHHGITKINDEFTDRLTDAGWNKKFGKMSTNKAFSNVSGAGEILCQTLCVAGGYPPNIALEFELVRMRGNKKERELEVVCVFPDEYDTQNALHFMNFDESKAFCNNCDRDNSMKWWLRPKSTTDMTEWVIPSSYISVQDMIDLGVIAAEYGDEYDDQYGNQYGNGWDDMINDTLYSSDGGNNNNKINVKNIIDLGNEDDNKYMDGKMNMNDKINNNNNNKMNKYDMSNMGDNKYMNDKINNNNNNKMNK
eukprot:24803_1